MSLGYVGGKPVGSTPYSSVGDTSVSGSNSQAVEDSPRSRMSRSFVKDLIGNKPGDESDGEYFLTCLQRKRDMLIFEYASSSRFCITV